MTKTLALFGAAGLAVAAAVAAAETPATAGARGGDVAAIRAHIDTIFRAYIAGDRETVRATHSEDWRGFLNPSRSVLRGIDDYMQAAEPSLRRPGLVGYEMLEFDVQFHGDDLAVVCYVAALDVEIAGARLPTRPKLRVLDVYARRAGEWIQVASNTVLHPETQEALRRLPSPVSGVLRAESLAAREQVWRAWFAGDRAALERALPAEALALDPGVAEWRDRPAILAAAAEFAGRGPRLGELRLPRTEIQLYGDVAVLYTSYALTLDEGAGEPVELTGRGTEIFVRRGDGWVNAGWHLDAAP